jgi:hypothetical protein
MEQNGFSKRILVGITGKKKIHWKNKLNEVKKYKISEVALFLECFDKLEREKIYEALLNSNIKKIPLVHISNDTSKEEIKFLVKNFNSRYFTIHEDSFNVLERWKGFFKKLFLEMNIDNFVSRIVNINKIGGFCVDLSHFKVEEQKWSKEFEYIIKRENNANLFACNHLNGYSYEDNIDLHTIKTLKNFDYLNTLPKFLFGKTIALETENSISEQLKFKSYLTKILNNIFNK